MKVPVYANASITRFIAGCVRFFTLIQCFDRPGLVPLLRPARDDLMSASGWIVLQNSAGFDFGS